MDSVPYDFIERTIVLTTPIFIPILPPIEGAYYFTSLEGHWGRFAKRLLEETVEYDIVVNDYLTDFYCTMFKHGISVRVEDLLEKKHTRLACLACCISSPPIEARRIDDRQLAMIQRLLRRSYGVTKVILDTRDASLFDALLDAIPRVWKVRVNCDQRFTTEGAPTIGSLVKKHVQRGCLRRLTFNGQIPRSLFPATLAFLKEAKYTNFEGEISPAEEKFAKQMICFIAENLKKRRPQFLKANVRVSQVLLAELKKEIDYGVRDRSLCRRITDFVQLVATGKVEEEGQGKILIRGIERSRLEVEVTVFEMEYSSFLKHRQIASL